MNRAVAFLPALAAAALAGASTTPAAPGIPDDPRIDQRTGASLANWPPARHFDHRHMRLEIDIPTMTKPRARVREVLTVAAIGRDRGTLELDAVDSCIEVRAVSMGARLRPFHHEDNRLAIHLDPPVPPGEEVEIVIDYDLDYRAGGGAGLTWSPGNADSDSATGRAPQIHSQGQPNSNSKWICCHDFPNERVTTELVVTCDDGLQVCSNGRLLGKQRADAGSKGQGRSTWHWLQDKEHAYYLVVLVVGLFDVVDVGGPSTARPGLPMPVYTQVGTADVALETFAETPAMVAFFEGYFDEPYPWDKYAQLMVRNFMAGGMENTSATTLTGGATMMGPEGARSLIAHELAHQWMGDLLTCKSWAHTWLNEGWASYAEALFEEDLSGRREYLKKVRGFLGGERGNRTTAPEDPPLVSNRWTVPLEPFMRPNNAYSRGALVLHMLRERLGPETFQEGVRLYIDRYRLRCVETDDFRKVLEEVSGQDLERFFHQWCFRPGPARLGVSFDWDESASALAVSMEQTQRIDADNPAFAVTVPLYVKYENGRGEYVYADMDQQAVTATFELPEKPVDVAVDPNITFIGVTKVEKEIAMWVEQLETGPTIVSRLDALDYLSRCDEPAAREAVAAAALDRDVDVRAAALAFADSGSTP